MNQPSKREHLKGIAVVLFVFSAFCFRDVSVSNDSLFVIPGILFAVAGLYALRGVRRQPRS